MPSIEELLSAFAKNNKFTGKGALSLALIITRKAIESGLPLNPDILLTDKAGQVAGLSKSTVQKILADYQITKILAEEAGRTSRGNIDNMRKYVAFLNDADARGLGDLKKIEKWWAGKVSDFFASHPFKLKMDQAKSLRSIIGDLLEQALKRQRETSGTMYMGTMLQHLVGAKLQLITPSGSISHHGASVADSPTNRDGDFLIEQSAIHVTTAPSEALIRKCLRNLEAGLRPIIVTTKKGAGGADALAGNLNIDTRIEIFEIEQFLSINIYEKSGFSVVDNRKTVSKIIDIYNSIIDECETDPSLKIELA